MKKQLLVVLLSLVLVFSMVSLIACVEPEEQPTTYTLTYAAGEGSGTAPAAASYEAGAKITLKAANTFTAPAGKEFDGWLIEGSKLAAGAEYTMPAKNVTATAQWKTTSTVEPTVTLSSISATYEGTIELNGSLDATKLTVTATYSDESSKTVTGTAGAIDTATAGDKQVTITYTEGDVTKTCTVTITVVDSQPEPDNSLTLYFYNADGWEIVNAHIWVNQGGNLTGNWPGKAMTEVDGHEDWYQITVEADLATQNLMAIFNNKVGDNGTQTGNLTVTEGNLYFIKTGGYASFEAAEEAAATPIELPKTTLYFYNSENWANVYVHAWIDQGASLTQWPGVKGTAVDGHANWIQLTIEANIPEGSNVKVKFNNNNGTETDALDLIGENIYFINAATDYAYASFEAAEAAAQPEEPTPEELLTKYLGVWAGSFKYDNYTTLDNFKLTEDKISFHEKGDGFEDYYDNYAYTYTIALNDDGNLVLTINSNFTVTFTSDTTCTVKKVTTGLMGTTTTADFAKGTIVTVSFDLGENYQGTTAPIADQQMIAPAKLTAPATPEWHGYKFLGWFLGDATEAFDFANTTIAENTALTAKWEQITQVTVTFAIPTDVTGFTAPDAQTLAFDATATEPNAEAYAREGYQFDGWYLNGAKEAFDFTTQITDNITLTAKWSQLFTVTYVYPAIMEMEAPAAKEVAKFDYENLPECPKTIEGYEFIGWAIKEEGKTYAGAYKVAGAKEQIAANTTITAIYGVKYTNGNNPTPCVVIRTDGWISSGSTTTLSNHFNQGQYTEYKFNNEISAMKLGNYDLEVRLNHANKTATKITHYIYEHTLTANDDVTVMKFDGVENVLLGDIAGTYTESSDHKVITLTFAGTEYTLNVVYQGGFAINGYLKITIDGTNYEFGEAPEEPDPEKPDPEELLKNYLETKWEGSFQYDNRTTLDWIKIKSSYIMTHDADGYNGNNFNYTLSLDADQNLVLTWDDDETTITFTSDTTCIISNGTSTATLTKAA